MRRKNALVIGIANRDSISAGIARELYNLGYNIIPTYLNERALPHVQEVTDGLGVEELFPFLVHGIAYSAAKGAKLDLGPGGWGIS